MKDVGYYNGKTGPIGDMMIPMNDRAVYFGDGVYDATYAANGNIYKRDYHIDRFFNSMNLLKMPFAFTKEGLVAEIQKCIDLMDDDGCVFVYWQVSRGTGMRNHIFPADKKSNLLIFVSSEGLTDLRRPIKTITVEDTRFLHCNIKTLNLIPSVMAAELAEEKGCQEAIFHRGERVTECAHSNVSILKGGTFITAPLDNLILPGTGRRHFLELCKRVGVPSEERPFTLGELFSADEIMITNCGNLGVSVCELDGKKVGGKDVSTLKKLQRAAVEDFIAETGFIPDIL